MSSEVACLAIALCEGWETSLFLTRPRHRRDRWSALAFARDDRSGLLSSLRSQLELVARNAAQLKKADQCFFNQIVRARCARSDPNDSGLVRQPEMRNHFALLVQVVMFDLGSRNQSRGVEHKIGWELFFAHFGEMGCVRTIITAHD